MNELHARAARFAVAAVEHARSLHRSPLAPDVARLHRLFTSDRAERRPDYQRDPALRRAYLGFFLPFNAVKIALLLDRARREGLLPAPPEPAVLDIGAGPLTGVFAAWIAYGRLGPCVAVDAAAAAMSAAEPLLSVIAHGGVAQRAVNVALRPASSYLEGTRPHLVIVANVLNELRDPRRGADTRGQLSADLVAALAPGGRVLMVEPATRVHGRALMVLRDRLVAERQVSVLAPCRGATTCPLLRGRGDWCHGEHPWDPPGALAELARAAGIEKAALKESHLLLAPRSEAPSAVGLRLVGGPMRDNSGTERRYACGVDGLATLVGTPGLPRDVVDAARGALLAPVPAGLGIELRPSRAPGARAAARGAGRSRPRARAGAGPRRR
ncbi:MAG: hypothetical protein IT383_04065 [Deltaproteobacteria bacterium]|nr:hypothetical protein [Deltaproteobacteria bacterium]